MNDFHTDGEDREMRVTGAPEIDRQELIERFARWLDQVLSDEADPAGIDRELLDEIRQRRNDTPDDLGQGQDAYSLWSALTALTQEIKLQGRAFKRLHDVISPQSTLLTDLNDQVPAINRQLEEQRRKLAVIDERVRAREPEADSTPNASSKINDEGDPLIELVIDINDRLLRGIEAAAEQRRKARQALDRRRPRLFGRKSRAMLEHLYESNEALIKGYRLSLDRIGETLQLIGVERIECLGKPFDPRLMRAVDLVEDETAADGTVTGVFRNGYLRRQTVFRPAEVQVCRRNGQENQP